MKLLFTLRALFAAFLIASATAATAAPTLLITNGILMGANNVSVNGTLYNVTFADGSCNSLFNGCVQSTFAFTTQSGAAAAARSLLDTVFIDVPSGKFDTVGNTTFGCTGLSLCITYIPYSTSVLAYTATASVNYYNTDNGLATPNDVVSAGSPGKTSNTQNQLAQNFAIFQVADATVIPEPGTIALLGLALAGMTALRRRKS